MANRLAFAILRHCYSDISALGNNLVKSQIHALYENYYTAAYLADGWNEYPVESKCLQQLL